MFNPSQQQTLMTILDTFVPQLSKSEAQALLKTYRAISPTSAGNKREDEIRRLLQFAKAKPSDRCGYEHDVLPFLTALDKSDTVHRVVKMMGNGLGMCVLTKGRWSTAFDELSDAQRVDVLKSWKAKKSPHRLIYRLLCITAMFLMYQQKGPVRAPVVKVTQAAALEMRFDAILIGSGAAAGIISNGKGPCAWTLTQAGKSVLVIEKVSPQEHPSKKAMHGYENGELWASMDGNLTLAAGSALDGGANITRGALVKTPLYVLQDWKRRTNDGFDVATFEKDLQTVVEHWDTSSLDATSSEHMLLRGCQQLEYPVSRISHATHSTWFEQVAAATHLEAHVTQILVRHGHVDGVVATLPTTGESITLHARTVIMTAGAIQTPALLMKSGLKNKHIGQHLKVHPTVYVNATMFSSTPAATAVLNNNNDKGDEGTTTITHHMKTADAFGCRIEAPIVNPGLVAATVPWHGGLHHKQSILGDGCTLSVMGRDMSSAATTDAMTKVRVDFSDRDLATLNEGVVRALDIMVAAGARLLHPCHLEIEPFLFKSFEQVSTTNPRYTQWLDHIRHTGLSPADGIYSLHQMGSCRLGYSSKTSAVQLTGETWEVKNLYVADGSIMPSACGVHPIVTIQALALGVARKVLLRLNSKPIDLT